MNAKNNKIIRQIFLDTETTGMNKMGIHYEGHRIIEIGAVEVINRHITGRYYHVYLKPNRLVDPAAFKVHGISNEFLLDKPIFSDIADEFIDFIRGSELVIHNAPFDIGFIDYEFSMLNGKLNKIKTFCDVIDSLRLAQKIFPGKRNNLDALCDRYLINRKQRTLHSAFIDAEILAKIFLHMTGGQTTMNFIIENEQEQCKTDKIMFNERQLKSIQVTLKIIYANKKEITAHNQYLNLIKKKSGCCLWQLNTSVRKEQNDS